MRPNVKMLSMLTAVAAFAIAALLALGVGFANASSGTTNVVAQATVNSICSMSVSNTAIDFGQVDPTASAPTSNAVALIDTGGNAAGNILVAGANWISGGNGFYVINTLWNPTTSASASGNTLTLWNGIAASLVDTYIVVPAPSQGNPDTQANIFFGVNVPAGAPAGIYTQNIIVGNSCNSQTSNVAATVNVPSTCFIGVTPSSINFGSINPGTNVPTNKQVTVQDPGGNIAANVLVDGGNWVITSGTANFFVTNTLWDMTSQATYAGTAVQLFPGGLTDTGILIAAPTIGTSTTSNSIYFGLAIPGGTTAGAYTQNIILENKC